MTSPELQQLARQLLLCYQGQTELKGPIPSQEELSALMDGRLTFSRKQEVYAYLNRSPELFSKWVALVEAVDDTRDIQDKGFIQVYMDKLFNFFSGFSLPVLPTSIAAVLFLVISVNYMPWQKEEAPWSVWYSISDRHSLGKETLNHYLFLVADDIKGVCSEKGTKKFPYKKYYQVLIDIKAQFVENEILPPSTLTDIKRFTDKSSACQFNSELFISVKK